MISTGLPPSMKSGDRSAISFALYDQEDKRISNGSFADLLRIQIMKGNANIQEFKFDKVQKQFNAFIQPQYIDYEDQLKLMIQYFDVAKQVYSRLNEYDLHTKITQNLFMNYTKVAVENGRINKDLDYKIYLKDNNGYCFDENTGDDEVMLKVKLVGPYIMENKVINYRMQQI